MGLSVQTRAAGPKTGGLPRPEEVFLAWILGQPPGVDLAAAADAEIERLARYDGQHSGPAKLTKLFREFRRSLTCEMPAAPLQ